MNGFAKATSVQIDTGVDVRMVDILYPKLSLGLVDVCVWAA